VKLTRLHFALYLVKESGNGCYSALVTNQNYAISQLFRAQMQMEYATISIDRKF
jgi:hypothetical protein